MSLALTILPVALAIFIGWGARVSGLVREDMWPTIESFSFRLLIPLIVIHSIAGADLSPSRIGAFSVALLATVLIVGTLVFVLKVAVPADRLSPPTLSTLFQTGVRYNGFMSLAIADQMLGAPGLTLIAVSMALMIPLNNVAVIVVMVVLVGGESSPRRILKTVATNPLVLGAMVGIAVNLAGGLPVWIGDAFEIVGRAALGVGLVSVGAGLSLNRLLRVRLNILVGLLLRPVLVTVIFMLLAHAMHLTELETLAGILIFAVPAASNGYVVARLMGGNAGLYADLLAWQALLSIFAIPAFAAFV